MVANLKNVIETINPANGEIRQTYPLHTANEIETRLASADANYKIWSKTALDKRLETLLEIKKEFLARADECARLMTAEMGKPITQAHAEVKKCISLFDSVAASAETWLRARPVEVSPDQAWIEFASTGVLLAIMPWNFPFWQVIRFAVPQLAAGNVVVLKHASNSTGVAQLIERIFRVGNSPASLVQALIIPGAKVSTVIEDRRIRGVTLTGSTAAGRNVASVAGKFLKKHVLELGGSDAYLILEKADVKAAAKLCVQSRLLNSGQSCIAAKRFIVNERVADAFVQGLQAEMEKQVMGDPMDTLTTIGPLARADLRDEVVEQIRRGTQQELKSSWGGQSATGPGFYLRPGFAIVESAENEIFKAEVFGPFAAILIVRTDDEALLRANASVYGLGGAVFTKDIEEGRRFASAMECGSCFINDFVKSDPRVPFGGVKDSGYGRELTEFGLYEFLNVKTVWTKQT